MTRNFAKLACCVLALSACGETAPHAASTNQAAPGITQATIMATDMLQEGSFDPALLETSNYRCVIGERYFADIDRIILALDQSAKTQGDEQAHYFAMIVVQRAGRMQRIAFSAGNDKILYDGVALRTDYDFGHAMDAVATASCGENWWH